METSNLTPLEMKNLVIKEVVIKHLKDAGFKSKGQTFYSLRNDICLTVKVWGNRFNSQFTGYSFDLRIEALPADTWKDKIKFMYEYIDERCFLPKCGFLHPYHSGLGYTVGGYQDGVPIVQKNDDIRDYINNDFEQYIIPGLQKIQCQEDYDKVKKEYLEYFDSPEISLLRFFSGLQSNANLTHETLKVDFEWIPVKIEDIKANRDIYEQVREYSGWPSVNKWDQLMLLLTTYF